MYLQDKTDAIEFIKANTGKFIVLYCESLNEQTGDREEISDNQVCSFIDENGAGEVDNYRVTLKEHNGGEGQGDYMEAIYEVFLKGKSLLFIRQTAFYDSYAGSEWNDDYEVVYPTPVTKIEYLPKA